jgi:hypothetical protein
MPKKMVLNILPEDKKCTLCHEIKPAAQFLLHKRPSGNRNLSTRCRACTNKLTSAKRTKRDRKRTSFPYGTSRICKHCNQFKSSDELILNNSGRDVAVTNECKECRLRIQKEQRAKDNAKFRKWERDYLGRLTPEQKAARIEKLVVRNRKFSEQRNAKIRADRKINPIKYKAKDAASHNRVRDYVFNKTVTKIGKEVRFALEAYRVGDEYWDVYNSRLIKCPSIDHVIPLVSGGDNDRDNLVPTARGTNSSKGKRSLIVWMARMRRLEERANERRARLDRTRREVISAA